MPSLPSAQANFATGPTFSSPAMPTRARLKQADCMHEVLLLTYQPELPSASRYASAVPVAASLGYVPGATGTFYGYSDVTQPRYQVTKSKQTSLFCTGATYPLKDAGEAFWADGTPVHLVVAAIANRFRLSATVVATDVPAPPGPHNQSWWAYLRQCADELGWVVRARATDIEFMPRRLDTSTQLLFSYDPVENTTTKLRIYGFTATTGDTVPGARKATTALGVADDGSVVTLTDNSFIDTPAARVVPPSLSGTVLPRPVSSAADAVVQLAAQAERTRLSITAEAELTGDARIRNGATLLLRGLDTLNNGYWYVDEADHCVTQNTLYRTHVKLCRGGQGDPAPTYVPGPRVWFSPGDQAPTLPPATQYVDGGPLPLAQVAYGRWSATQALTRVVTV